MNDNMNNNVLEEKEINLMDMLFYICKRWRGLLLSALVVMVLIILVKVPAFLELKSAVTILKQIIIYAVIGVLIGLIFTFIIYAFSYAINGKIKSENEFKSNCRLNILGVLPKKNSKKLNCIDRLVRRMFGVDRSIEDFERLADRMSEEIKAVLSADGSDKKGEADVSCIAVVSTESDETAHELISLINEKLKGTAKVIEAGNILKNAESIRIVMKSDRVLLAERIAASKYQMIEETYKKLAMWEKDVVGIVLFDGDVR